MQSLSLESGPVPPLAILGNSFYPVLQKYGTKRTSGKSADEGDVVAYFEEGFSLPSHVATVCKKGIIPTVISKDQEERVYITAVGKVNCEKYRRYEIWRMPWADFRVQIIAGPIEFSGVPVVTPAAPYVGDTVTVTAKFKVRNLPEGDLEMTADSTLINGTGDLAGRPMRKHPSPRRVGAGDTAYLDGEETFQAVVTKPGEHSWLLTLSARQAPGTDEGAADYETQNKTATFTVLERPEIANLDLVVDPEQVPEGGQATIKLSYKVKGVPDPAKPPLRMTRVAEQTQFVQDGAGARPRLVTRSLGRDVSLLNSPTGEVVVKRNSKINKAGSAGTKTIRVALKMEIPGRAPIEVTKECAYQVVKQ